MQKLKNYITYFFDIGIKEHFTTQEKFRLRFFNGLHFLMIVILLIGILFWAFFLNYTFIAIKTICILLCIAGLVLNYFHKYNISSFLFYLYSNLLIFYHIEFYPIESASYLYYFPFLMAIGINSLSIFRDAFFKLNVLLSVLVFLSIILIDFKDNFQINSPTESQIIEWFRTYNILITALCIVFIVLFYIWLSNTQINEIKNLLEKEKKLQNQLLSTLQQKEVLLAEVHHRVNNNLAILHGIINMKLSGLQDEKPEEILSSLQNRIHNMNLVHNLLYTHEAIDNISMDTFIKKIIYTTITKTYQNKIHIIENIDKIKTIKASAMLPLGIILHEILSNAVHHAFSGINNPSLKINVYHQDEHIVLTISDNGKGISSNYKKGLGMELIYLLVEQMNGRIHLINNAGLTIKICMPKSEILMT